MSQDDDSAAARLHGLFGELSAGNSEKLDALISQFYGELKRIARSSMVHERPDHTLQPTALVNELYLRMHGEHMQISGVQHFLSIAATVMRRILVEHARGRSAVKRGSGVRKLPLEGLNIPYEDQRSIEVLALDEALNKMGPGLERKRKALELQYFLGLELDEIAVQLEVSVATVKTDLRFAKGFLRRAMSANPG